MATAIRIRGKYENENFTATSIERVEMLSPASDSLEGFNNLVGFWMELRDKKDKPLYRLIIPDPFRPEVEVFNPINDQNHSMNIVPRKDVSGHLVLLVPDSAEAAYVALVRSKADKENKKINTSDIVRIPVH